MIECYQLEPITFAAEELAGVDAPWAVCGGWAIDLYLNKLTWPHKDVDFAIRRRDQLVFQRHLEGRGWSLEVAENGATQS